MDLAALPLFALSHIVEIRAAVWHLTVWGYALLERLGD